LFNDDSYKKVNINNESCIDEINMMVKLENGIIKDVRFAGEACAICTSSTSIMIKLLLNKTIDEAQEIMLNFENMINEKPYNKEILKEAQVYDELYKQPNRIKCALLPWECIKKVIK
ncbi:MAG: SUF system NifU family Fe-S cluster assembly protein, partial [Bacilli bacterium]|nr:SUF system NifU family Fe-S cluster assembly protein [Bacilli bacterium]